MTGSGLLELIRELRRAGVVDRSGRFARSIRSSATASARMGAGVRRLLITDQGVDLRGVESPEEAPRVPLYLTQHDIRELQKAKGAIRTAMEILLARLELTPATCAG